MAPTKSQVASAFLAEVDNRARCANVVAGLLPSLNDDNSETQLWLSVRCA